MVVYCFYVQPFYDNLIKEYTHIIVINCEPVGPLKNYIRKTVFPKLSTFEGFGSRINKCVYAIKNIDGGCSNGGCSNGGCNNVNDLLTIDNLDSLVIFLMENGYIINKDISEIMNNEKINVNNGKKLLFYVNYNN